MHIARCAVYTFTLQFAGLVDTDIEKREYINISTGMHTGKIIVLSSSSCYIHLPPHVMGYYTNYPIRWNFHG